MTPSQKDLRLLYQRSGNHCAFPECTEELDYPANDQDEAVVLSEVAHIIAQSPYGPRGSREIASEDLDKYDNLILLCREHHRVVDSQPNKFTPARLRQMKVDHEKLMQEATARAVETRAEILEKPIYVRETLFSTLLPVIQMPQFVYGVPCKFSDAQENEVSKAIIRPNDEKEIYPFIIRAGMLYCFQNLRNTAGPFQKIIGNQRVTREGSYEWWDDPDRMRWYVNLLNRALNKLTGRKGLNRDKRHDRYYFMPIEVGRSLEITYQPLNQSKATRQVVWRPITKKTGEPKSYWYHSAVSLRFHRISNRNWCLSIRPELHITKDGATPIYHEYIGSKVTRKMARTYNYDLLGEVHFWRDFLSDSQPRILMFFGGGQYIHISTTFMQTEVSWPGMPEEFQRPFKNVSYSDDLFTWAALRDIENAILEADEWDEEEEESRDGE